MASDLDAPPAGALAAAKAYLRIETADEDALIGALIAAAIGIGEAFLGTPIAGADWATLPAPVRQGVVRLAAHLHAHRDGEADAGPPAAVAALWRPFRALRLGRPA